MELVHVLIALVILVGVYFFFFFRRSEPRELRPRTSGVVQLRYGGRLRGRVTAQARIVGPPGIRQVARTFRIRL